MHRRDFIGRAALGAAAVSQAPANRQTLGPKAPSSDLKIAVVGLGRRGMKLLETVHKIPGTEVSVCCDIVGDRLDEARRFVRDIPFTALMG